MKMKSAIGMTLVTAFMLVACVEMQTTPTGPTTVLRGARVIDGSGAAPLDNATVVIRSGRIVAVGPTSSTPVPSGAEVIDYSGKTIMPGLISTHSHVGIVNGLASAPENYNRPLILAQLKQFEAYGVTTITSLGLNGPLFYELRDEMRAGRLEGADLLGADRGIGVTGGAPPASIVKLAENQLYRPETPEAARQAIREMAARKSDLVKIWLDDFGKFVPVKVKPEIYSAAIDEARKQGLRVAAHVHDIDDAKAILRAGAHIIAHGVRDQPVDAEFIRLMKANSVWYVPTIVLDDTNYIFTERPSWVGEAFFQQSLHPAVSKLINDRAWREKTVASPGAARARASAAMNKRNIKTLHDAGVQIAFGSDSGVGLRIPGPAEHRELALLVEAGLTPMQAIATATSHSAKALNLNDRGTIAPGQLADLIVLNADPSIAINNTTKINAVWHRGKRVAGPVEGFRP